MNNILQHFATAFLDLHLKDEAARGEYLDLIRDADAGLWSVDADGTPDEAHTYWTGFPQRSAVGLVFETREAGR